MNEDFLYKNIAPTSLFLERVEKSVIIGERQGDKEHLNSLA